MSYDSEVLSDTPQIYWKLQDASGTSAADSSGNARPGTYNGTATVNYALAQSVNLVSSDPTAKSVKFMRDSAVEGGHPTLKTNLSDASTTNGKASVSRAYEAWMNVAGAAFSAEAWVKVPSTLNRYASNFIMTVAARRTSSPLQWEMRLSGQAAVPQTVRWEAALSAVSGQPAYAAAGFYGKEIPYEVMLGGGAADYEQVIEDTNLTRYGDWYDSTPHHMVATAGTASLKMYADGLLGTSYFNAGLPAIPSNTADPVIFGGLNTTGNMTGLMGWMSHCAHYPSELSAARVAAHFTAGGTKVTFLNQQWQLLAATEMVLTESATVSQALAALQRQLVSLAESTTFTANMTAIVKQIIALAESATVTPALTPQQRLSVVFADSVTMSQQIVASRFVQMVLAGLAMVNDVLTPNSRSALSLADVITGSIILRADGQEMVGWIVNPNLMASTMLAQYDFIGFGEHKGRYYGLKPNGLYRLDGDTDNGAAINSFISLGNRDFGTAQMKRVPHAYIGAATDGTMVLKVLTNGQENVYYVRNPTSDMAEQRVDIGRGLRANYWNFELMNQNGEKFDISTIRFMPVVLERRI